MASWQSCALPYSARAVLLEGQPLNFARTGTLSFLKVLAVCEGLHPSNGAPRWSLIEAKGPAADLDASQ